MVEGVVVLEALVVAVPAGPADVLAVVVSGWASRHVVLLRTSSARGPGRCQRRTDELRSLRRSSCDIEAPERQQEQRLRPMRKPHSMLLRQAACLPTSFGFRRYS